MRRYGLQNENDPDALRDRIVKVTPSCHDVPTFDRKSLTGIDLSMGFTWCKLNLGALAYNCQASKANEKQCNRNRLRNVVIRN